MDYNKNTYFVYRLGHSPSEEYKIGLKDAFTTFIRTVTGGYYASDKIYVDDADFIIKMIRNFCKTNHIGTIWLDGYLEPTMRGMIKKGRKTMDLKYNDIGNIFEELVLKKYITNDRYNIKNALSKEHPKCKQLDRFYKNDLFQIKLTHTLTYNDVDIIINYLGMQKDRDEIINQQYYLCEKFSRYCFDKPLQQFEDEIKEICKETGAKYLGVIDRPDNHTFLNEDEIYICDDTKQKDGSRYIAFGNIRAYSLGVIENVEHLFSGLSRF